MDSLVARSRNVLTAIKQEAEKSQMSCVHKALQRTCTHYDLPIQSWKVFPPCWPIFVASRVGQLHIPVTPSRTKQREFPPQPRLLTLHSWMPIRVSKDFDHSYETRIDKLRCRDSCRRTKNLFTVCTELLSILYLLGTGILHINFTSNNP